VIPIRWPEFLKRTGDWSFVDDFRATAAKTPDSTPPFIEALTKAPLRERRSLLLNHIRSHVDHVLRTNTAAAFGPKQGFFEMGMDSLTAVELKNRLQTSLGCRLPSTVAFECPTIEALVDSLVKETLAPLFVPDQSVPTELPTVAARAEAENPEPQLSEEEVNGLLDEKLKAIETFLDK
jgi:acyl carrier protein